MDAKSFGAFIADQRRTLGLTQAEVAARLHVTDKAVSRWERGVGLPDINTLEPVCRSTSPCRMSAVIHPGLSGRAFAMSGQPCNFVGCRRTDRPCFLRRKVLYLSYCGIAAMSGVIFLALL